MAVTEVQMNAVKSSLERLAMDQEKFLKVQRKVRLDTVLQPVTNPMSCRAISLDHKVLNKVDDINALLSPDGVVFVVEAGQIPLAMAAQLSVNMSFRGLKCFSGS